MTLYDFKMKYLGQKKLKKPIVKEFQSSMIEVLHQITPKLKVAKRNSFNTIDSTRRKFKSTRERTFESMNASLLEPIKTIHVVK